MKIIISSELSLIGKGANGQVFKYNKPITQNKLTAVVKVSGRLNLKKAIENYDLINQTGVMSLAFYEECHVDGQPAILMEDLFTDEMVYVSPNSVRNGYLNNVPEAYLLQNKLTDIANMGCLLEQMRNLVICTDGKGIGLDMDMISFGVKKGEKVPEVSYKLVDIDGMLHDDSMRYKLYEENVLSAQEALERFVEYFVETRVVQDKLIQQIKNFLW